MENPVTLNYLLGVMVTELGKDLMKQMPDLRDGPQYCKAPPAHLYRLQDFHAST